MNRPSQRKTDYLFRDNQLIIRETTERVGGFANDFLTKLVDIPAIVIKNPIDGVCAMALGAKGNSLYLATELPYLNFNTWYKAGSPIINGENVPNLVPVWVERDGAIKMSLDWYPPKYMSLIFISVFRPAQGNLWEYYDTLLVAKIGDQIHRPPIPNVYSDGRICMGSHFERPTPDTSIFEAFEHAVNDFTESEYNSDLIEDQCKHLQFMEVEGKQTPVNPEESVYKQSLPIISIGGLEWISQI